MDNSSSNRRTLTGLSGQNGQNLNKTTAILPEIKSYIAFQCLCWDLSKAFKESCSFPFSSLIISSAMAVKFYRCSVTNKSLSDPIHRSISNEIDISSVLPCPVFMTNNCQKTKDTWNWELHLGNVCRCTLLVSSTTWYNGNLQVCLLDSLAIIF